MWGLAAGIPLGILQYFLSNMFIKIITLKEHENRKKAILWMLVDIVVVIGIFVVTAVISTSAVLWTATGLCASMILLAVVQFIINLKKQSEK